MSKWRRGQEGERWSRNRGGGQQIQTAGVRGKKSLVHQDIAKRIGMSFHHGGGTRHTSHLRAGQNHTDLCVAMTTETIGEEVETMSTGTGNVLDKKPAHEFGVIVIMVNTGIDLKEKITVVLETGIVRESLIGETEVIETRRGSEAGTRTDLEIVMCTGTEIEIESHIVNEISIETSTGTGTETSIGTGTETSIGTGTETYIETGTETNIGTGTETSIGTGIDTVIETPIETSIGRGTSTEIVREALTMTETWDPGVVLLNVIGIGHTEETGIETLLSEGMIVRVRVGTGVADKSLPLVVVILSESVGGKGRMMGGRGCSGVGDHLV